MSEERLSARDRILYQYWIDVKAAIDNVYVAYNKLQAALVEEGVVDQATVQVELADASTLNWRAWTCCGLSPTWRHCPNCGKPRPKPEEEVAAGLKKLQCVVR